MARRTFRPPWWSVALVLALSATMISLGVWQIQRGQAKVELGQRYLAASTQAPREITSGAVSEPGLIERATATGHYDASRQLLLDNQSHDGVPGYRVWTPLLFPQGGIVLIDRGWLPASGDRNVKPEIPAPSGDVTVTGYWRELPRPGMELEADNCAQTPWPRIVQYPTPDDFRCIYGEYVAGGILLMDPDLPGGFTREWTTGPEMSPTKHYGYAAQWFGFTATLWVIFVVMNLKRKK